MLTFSNFEKFKKQRRLTRNFTLDLKRVAVPVNGYYLRGEHIVEIRRNDLQKGLYLYRLEADGFSASRRMIVN